MLWIYPTTPPACQLPLPVAPLLGVGINESFPFVPVAVAVKSSVSRSPGTAVCDSALLKLYFSQKVRLLERKEVTVSST